MRRTLFLLAAVSLLGLASGCCHHKGGLFGSCQKAPETCQGCKPGLCRHGAGAGCSLCAKDRAQDNAGNFAAGPPTGQITYPYYTTRGPRDFLARDPNSIGP